MMRATITAFAVTVGLAAVAQDAHQLVMSNIVVISAGGSAGTGFLATLNGTNYLITNEHVLRCGLPFKAQLLDGTVVEHGRSIRLSQDSDIVLIATRDQARRTLDISAALPSIGSPVQVVGNQGGHGVLTVLTGDVVAVGPNKLEISADIQPGNSGSPVILGDATVVGIATYASREFKIFDSSASNSMTRRFAYRIHDNAFANTDAARYFAVANALTDLDTFSGELRTILDRSLKGAGYDLAASQKRYKGNSRLAEILDEYSLALRNQYDIEHAVDALAARYGHDINRIPASAFDSLRESLHNRSLKSFQDDLARAHQRLASEPTAWIERNTWPTPWLKSEALAYRNYIQSVVALLPGRQGKVRIE